jgi:hypothetical protein
MKLISMKDFVLEQLNDDRPHISDQFEWDLFNHCFVARVENYANFLNQPLTLGMFVPCDEDGDVLEEPDLDIQGRPTNCQPDYVEFYQQAKERVLFEDVTVGDVWVKINNTQVTKERLFKGDLTIECLIEYIVNLTESAKKQIGL